jgi:hypothetical protein
MEPHAPVDIVAATTDTFTDHAAGFLDAMVNVWPECQGLRGAQAQFDATLKCGVAAVRELARRTAITKFHTALAPFYARVRENDGSIFFETTSGMLADIHMADKWRDPTIDDETRAAIFEWLQHMCDSAEMYSFYSKVPPGMLTRITGLATDLSKKGHEAIDPVAIGRLMTDIPEADMQEFAQSMMAQPGSLNAIVGMMGRLGGGGGPTAAGAAGGIDVQAILRSVQGAPGMMPGGGGGGGGGALATMGGAAAAALGAN